MDTHHVGYFTKLNYKSDTAIYTFLDDYTVNTRHLCFPSFVACTASAASGLILRTAAVAEDILHGIGVFLVSPVSKHPTESRQRGWKILKQVPEDTKEVLRLPFEYIYFFILAVGEPKLLIVEGIETAEVYRKHLGSNTVGTKEFHDELKTVGVRANVGLLVWQNASYSTLEDLESERGKYHSRWITRNLNRREELISLVEKLRNNQTL